jgi:two-component system sensor histidine kinase UhpB
MVALARRLLRLSLFAKILIANSAIVALGAVVGTYVTTAHTRRTPDGSPLEIMALFGLGGFVLSLVCNALVLRTALWPLWRLERTARRVRDGDLAARVTLGAIGDPDTDQLAATFNAMLDSLRERTRETEAYSARLRELSDKVLVAQEDERHRLAAELHDETGQSLSSLLLGLRVFRDAVEREDVDRDHLRRQAADLAEMARETLDGVRRLALELRPRMLDDLGLATALRAYADEWSQRTRIALRFDGAVDPRVRFPAAAEIAVYRMVQEALATVAKHSGATSAAVSLAIADNALVAEVRDNGRGMARRPPRTTPEDRRQTLDRNGTEADGRAARDERVEHVAGGLSAGLGLFSIQERISLAGGTFEVRSLAGQGTTLRAVIPLPPDRGNEVEQADEVERADGVGRTDRAGSARGGAWRAAAGVWASASGPVSSLDRASASPLDPHGLRQGTGERTLANGTLVIR